MLREQIVDAWNIAIGAYRFGRINSERTLQAIIYSELQAKLSQDHLVLCEPQFSIDGIGTVIPDIVIVQDLCVVAAIEMKFVPHWFPEFEGDLRKLCAFSTSTNSFRLTLDHESGKFSDREYRFSSDCLLVFLAIGRSDAAVHDETSLEPLMRDCRSQFLALTYPVLHRK